MAGLFFLAGKWADVRYSGSKSAVVDAPVDKVWNLVDDTRLFSESRHEVSRAEILGTNASGFDVWKEHTNLAGTISLEVVRKEPPRLIEVRMNESGFGMTGTWTYEFEPEGERTKVTVTENSVTEGLLMRSILNLLGRDANLNLHLKAIKKGAEI